MGTALVVLFGRSETLTARVLASPLPVGIGLISYSSYLFHQPLFAFARLRLSNDPGFAVMAGLSLAALFLGYLSWRFVEQPFRGQVPRRLPRRRQVFGASLGIAVALFTVALVIRQADGFPNRVTERFAGEIGHRAFGDEMDAQLFDCVDTAIAEATPRDGMRSRCHQSKPGVPPTVVLFGDSHAEHLMLGLAQGLPDENVTLYLRNAPPLAGEPRFDDVFAALERPGGPHTVVYAMHWPRRFAEVDNEAAFRLRLEGTFRRLAATGAKVVAVGDLPWFANEPGLCKFAMFSESLWSCTAQREDALAMQDRYGAILREVASAADIPVVEVRSLFCSGGSCSMVKDGTMMFRDSNHLSVEGSDVVGRRVAEALRGLP